MCKIEPAIATNLFLKLQQKILEINYSNISNQIDYFMEELKSMENLMDEEARKIKDIYFPKMEEVGIDQDYINDIFINSRKTMEISEGKLAGIALYSQTQQNNVFINRVIEFILCLLITRERLIEYDLLIIESDVVFQLKEIYLLYHKLQKQLQLNVREEIKSIECETRESVIQKKLITAKALYKQLYDRDCDWYEKSNLELTTLIEKSRLVFDGYTKKVNYR
jgi:hypothetical protein